MPPRAAFTLSPPYDVESVVATLGQNIRTARLRRNLTLTDLAARIGADRHLVAKAEQGRLTTGIGVYAALLWALGLLDQLSAVADPGSDAEGQQLARRRERVNASTRKVIDNDF